MKPPAHPAALASILALACGTGATGGAPEGSWSPTAGAAPLVLIVVDGVPPPDPSIPWELAVDREHVSVGMIAPSRSEPSVDPVEALLGEALDEGMLVALIEAGNLPEDLAREHIQIWSDSSGAVRSIPGEIAASIPDSAWSVPIRRQMLLREVFDLYLPDLAVIRLRGEDPDELHQTARFWSDPGILSTRNLVLYAPSGETGRRGWVLIGGPDINGETPLGLSPGGLLATMEMLTGLDWESGIPARIPSMGIMTSPEGVPGS